MALLKSAVFPLCDKGLLNASLAMHLFTVNGLGFLGDECMQVLLKPAVPQSF